MNKECIEKEISDLKERLNILENQVNEEKNPGRYLRKGDKYYTFDMAGSIEEYEYNSDDIDACYILNNKAYFTKKECGLYHEVNQRLCIATMSEIDYTKEVFELMYDDSTGLVSTKGAVSYIYYLSKYLTNNENDLNRVIAFFGQAKLKEFFMLKPIRSFECEAFPEQKRINEKGKEV